MSTNTHTTTSGSVAVRDSAARRARPCPRRVRTLALAGIALIALAGLPRATVAQTTWSSSPTSGLWNEGGNWASGTAPASGASLVFATSSLITATNNFSSGTFASIAFNSGAPSYTLSGNALTLTAVNSQVLNNSSSDQTINFAISGPSNTELRSPDAWIILGTGGSVTPAQNLQIGWQGPTRIKVDGGLISVPSAGSILMRGSGTSTLWVTSGTVAVVGTNGISMAAQTSNATSVINLDGGVVQTQKLELGNSTTTTGGMATVNQTGGTLRVNTIIKTQTDVSNTMAFNLSGGTIAPNTGNLTFGSATASANIDQFTLTGNDGTISAIDSTGAAGVVTIFTAIGDSGSNRGLTFSGSGGLFRLAAAAANTYTGTTTVNSGTLQIGASGTTGALNASSVITGSSGATLAFARTDDYGGTFGNTISGGLGVRLSSGTLTLAGSSSHAGGTTISAGRLVVSNAAALGASSGALAVNGGTLDLNGTSVSVGALSGSSAAVITTANTTGTATLTTNVTAASTFAGVIQDNGLGSIALTKVGSGTLTLTGSNSYTGTTTVNSGRLQIGASGTTGALSASSVITGSSGATLAFARTDNYGGNFGNTISGGLGLRLTGGALTLTGSNSSYTGTTQVDGGTLTLSSADAIGSTGPVSFGGGTLRYTASNTADLSGRIAGSGSAIAIDTNGQSRNWTSSLAPTNTGGLTKAGSGTLTLSASNAFSGPVTVLGVSDNVLAVNHDSALGSGTSVTVQATAALQIGSGITTGAGQTITVQSNGGGTADGGLRVRSGTGTWAGTVTMDGGRLGYTNANLLVSGSVGGGDLGISGYGDGLTNTGSAFGVMLAGPAGYTGATNIVRGWLKIGADDTLPVGTTLDVFTVPNNAGAASAATFDLNGFNQTVAGLTSSGNNGKTGFANGYVTNTGPAVRTLTVNQATSGTYGGLMTGNLAFTKTGAGNLTLMPILVTTSGSNLFTSGTNTFTGDTRVDGGTLTLSTATGNTSLALFGSTFDSSGSGTLSFGSMTAATFGGLKGPGSLALENDSSQAVALTVGANNGSTSFAGVLSGLGSLVKSGSGALTLTNANTYAGTTAVAAGSLLVNGSLTGLGAVTVDSGATLGGSGSIAGAVTVNGFLSPGTSPGVLSVASLSLGGSSTSLFEINGLTRGTLYDGVDITGGSGPTYGGTLSINFGNLAAFDNGTTFDLFNFSGSPSGDYSTVTSTGFYAGTWSAVSSGVWNLESGGQTLTFSQSTGDIVIVPEPGALALAGLGIAAAALGFRRRRVTKAP